MNKKSLTLLFLTMLVLLFTFTACDFLNPTVAVSSVEFLKSEYTFSEHGATYQLAAVIKPDDATNR